MLIFCKPYILYVLKIYYFQVLEWIYFQKYGVSFIEQFSLNYISPWIGVGNDNNQQVPGIYIYDTNILNKYFRLVLTKGIRLNINFSKTVVRQ